MRNTVGTIQKMAQTKLLFLSEKLYVYEIGHIFDLSSI